MPSLVHSLWWLSGQRKGTHNLTKRNWLNLRKQELSDARNALDLCICVVDRHEREKRRKKKRTRDKEMPATICRFGIHNQFQTDDGANEGSIHFHHNFHQIQQRNCNIWIVWKIIIEIRQPADYLFILVHNVYQGRNLKAKATLIY